MNDQRRQKPFVIPVFIPHAGCPHQCLFCDQTRTTGRARKIPDRSQIKSEINQFLDYRRDLRRWTEIAFFGGNFLGLADNQILDLLRVTEAYIQNGQVQGIRFSTRPDTIDPHHLKLIRDWPVSTIEIGAQSLDASVLATARRGHGPDDTVEAMALLRSHGYRIGLQMMVGLPGETRQSALASAAQFAALAPDFIRIYPCLVLQGSPLAKWYRQNRYTPMRLDDSISLVKQIYRLMARQGIAVIRMGLQPTAELSAGAGVLAGPLHPAFGELVHSALWFDALDRALSRHHDLEGSDLIIAVHPAVVSRVRGHRNDNLKRLRAKFDLVAIQTRPCPDMPTDSVTLNGIACPLIPDNE